MVVRGVPKVGFPALWNANHVCVGLLLIVPDAVFDYDPVVLVAVGVLIVQGLLSLLPSS